MLFSRYASAPREAVSYSTPIEMLAFLLVMVGTACDLTRGTESCDFEQFEWGCDAETNTVCDNRSHTCVCKPEYSLDLNNGLCLQAIGIDGECDVSQECGHIANAKCFTVDGLELRYDQFLEFGDKIWLKLRKMVKSANRVRGICRCRQSHQYDADRRLCVYRVIGSACNHHIQCSTLVAHSECFRGVCRCLSTHYHSNDTCIGRRGFDQFCSNSDECQTSLYCGEHAVCKCRKNYELSAHSECVYKFVSADVSQTTVPHSNVWDNVVKVSGFVIILVVMLFLCSKRDTGKTSNPNSVRRRSTSGSRLHRRSSSVNSHRPLTQTSSNASRCSAYRTFEEPTGRQVSVAMPLPLPLPIKITRSTSESSEDVEYNPYQFDSLFPNQLSDNDDPPSYEEAIKETETH